jgi:hypothetical protein
VISIQRKYILYFHFCYFITVDDDGCGNIPRISAFKFRSPKLSRTYGIPFSIRNTVISSLTSRTKI